MKSDGLDNVRAERVLVPHWVRGEESLELITPVPRKLTMLGLGNSIATPSEGITAETVVVRSFEELDALGERVRGKIVVYNVPFTTYGATVRIVHPELHALPHGVAAIVRSITPSPPDAASGAMIMTKHNRRFPLPPSLSNPLSCCSECMIAESPRLYGSRLKPIFARF